MKGLEKCESNEKKKKWKIVINRLKKATQRERIKRKKKKRKVEKKSWSWRSWKLREQILWKRGRIKGRVIRRTSEDKVGNAFGFHANIILIPVSAVEPELGMGMEGPTRSTQTGMEDGAKRRGRDRTRREGVGTGQSNEERRGGSSWTEASNQGDIIFPLRPAVF